MITLQNLIDMEPLTIFDSGRTVDNACGVNMANSGRILKYVACRGYIHDWSIYVGFEHESDEYIKDYGDKVTNERNIKKLVPCDDEAFNMYRY